MAEMRERLAKDLNLTPDELAQKLRSGTNLFANRLAWAVSYLRKAEVLNPAARGVYRITDRGTELLKQNLPKITVKTLQQYPEIVQMYSELSAGLRTLAVRFLNRADRGQAPAYLASMESMSSPTS